MTIYPNAQKSRIEAIYRATEAWNNAPLHIKAMGAQFVLPILSALAAVSAELDAMQTAIEQKGGDHGGA